MSDDERPKKSWREIDAGRDRSPNRDAAKGRQGGESSFGQGKKGAARGKSYLAALDRLFESGGIAKAVAKAEGTPATGMADKEASRLGRLAAVRNAIGPDEITKAVDAYLKNFSWPQAEIDFASAALEHRDEAVVRQALTHLAPALAAGKPRRAATLAGRLRTLEELAGDREIQEQAKQLRSKL